MPSRHLRQRSWSNVALICLSLSFVGSILLSLGDGVAADAWLTSPHDHLLTMARTWISDFRFLSDQVLYGSIILFVGARFFEARAVLTIGFDKVDATKMAVHGPDEKGFIWVGRKYGSRAEGEAVVAALQARISAVAETEAGSDEPAR